MSIPYKDGCRNASCRWQNYEIGSLGNVVTGDNDVYVVKPGNHATALILVFEDCVFAFLALATPHHDSFQNERQDLARACLNASKEYGLNWEKDL